MLRFVIVILTLTTCICWLALDTITKRFGCSTFVRAYLNNYWQVACPIDFELCSVIRILIAKGWNQILWTYVAREMSTTEAPPTASLFQKSFGTPWYNTCDLISSTKSVMKAKIGSDFGSRSYLDEALMAVTVQCPLGTIIYSLNFSLTLPL